MGQIITSAIGVSDSEFQMKRVLDLFRLVNDRLDALYSKIGSDKERVLLVCVSYRSDYSYQSCTSAIC